MNTWAFPKSSRLLIGAQFQRIFQKAEYKVSQRHFLILARRNDLSHPRLGLVVAKKNIRLAVQRNRVKRHIRETFRLQQDHLGGIDAIVLPRSGADKLSDQQLAQQLAQLWQRLEAKRQVDKRETKPSSVEGP